ncbi:D-alanyl-D-alanine-carboxypeptidase/endopeptidase AmpH [Methyloceanibacter marginalis]|uniref:D-alanyl-D-alanine- carboxypeptidase/endopeptidase AmpH n=1 Tax=Methyloceanibacter marginalis TaxID=1774971 RepID=UPI0009F2B859|nr:D-alanyl-D-alanine-carboxypeptidase/endopeptidase AmpH [Methyloceanibacter marginalis]
MTNDLTTYSVRRTAFGLLAAACVAFPASSQAIAEDALLDEIVSFTGTVFFLEQKVPGLVIGAVRNGETAIYGFGEATDGGEAPDGDTVMRIGSITKAFTGQALAHLAADGTVSLTQKLGSLAPDLGTGATRTCPRSVLISPPSRPGCPARCRMSKALPTTRSHRSRAKHSRIWLKTEKLLYAPGTGVLYSNFAFDLLSIGLSEAAKTPYPELLEKHVTGPLRMKDTTFAPSGDQKRRLMQGHGFDGKALPDVPTGDVIVGSGGLYSTPNDLLRWMQWHLDRLSPDGAEARMLDHAAYLVRDGLAPVSGMDESGHMDAMSLGWVVMMPEGDRPLILQKAGGLQGIFCYIAFAPARDVAVFIAINQFDFGAAMAMAQVVNEMIANLRRARRRGTRLLPG